jgi:hypothetical protein
MSALNCASVLLRALAFIVGAADVSGAGRIKALPASAPATEPSAAAIVMDAASTA